MISPGNKVLIVPNSKITDEVLTNFSERGYIRLELSVSIPYNQDFDSVKQSLFDALKQLPNVLQTPLPEIGIESFDSHSIQIATRPFVKPDDYWQATFDVHQCIKATFYKKGVKVAYSEGVELGEIVG